MLFGVGWTFSLVVVCGLLSAAASCCGAWALARLGFGRRVRSSTSQALELSLSSCVHELKLFQGMWGLPGSPALAGRFSVTQPPGQAPVCVCVCVLILKIEV